MPHEGITLIIHQIFHSSEKSYRLWQQMFPLTLQGQSLMVELQNLYSLVLKHIRSYLELIESIYRTLVLLPAGTIYRGTCKHYSVEKVLYKSILSEVVKSGNGRTDTLLAFLMSVLG